MDPLTPLTLSVVQEVLAQMGLLPVQQGYTVQTRERLNLPPACHPETVDRDALLLQKVSLAVEVNPHSAANARVQELCQTLSV